MLFFESILVLVVTGATTSTTGRDFIVSFFEKYRSGEDQMKLLVIFSQSNTTVHIEGFGMSDDIDVTEEEEYIYQMDQDTYYKANLEVKSNMTIRVTSENDISLFCYNYAKLQGDGYLAIPISSLSMEYMVVTSSSNNNSPDVGTNLPFTGNASSVFLILATENNTQVSINLKMSGSRMAGGCAEGTFFDGQTQTFGLDENDAIGAYCTDDLTGTIITSNKPVAVLSGNNYEYTISGSGDLPGHFVEMLLPKSDLGRNFVLYAPPNPWGDGAIYKVVASEDTTSMRTSIGTTFNINTGEYVGIEVIPTTGPVYLETNKPITVVQFSIADASMALTQPTHMYANSYDVCKFAVSPALGDFYLTVTVPTDNVLQMDPDIFPQFTVIEGSPFSMAELTLSTGCLVVSHLDGVPFGAMVNVLGPFGGHHSHPAGFNLTDVTDKTTCPLSNVCDDGIPYPCNCETGYFEYAHTDTSGGCGVDPCYYNSTCNPLTMAYTCSCINETAGAHCQVDMVDNCVNHGCVNGVCVDEVGAYGCNCTTSGYEGVFCEKDIDECLTSPCVNGSCVNLIGNYTCACAPGYEGLDCDTDIDECAPGPCVNGVCMDLVNNYTCTCLPGYEGGNCDTDINECLDSPCLNGICTNTVGNYTCSCDPGYEGVNCETDIDECAPGPCINGVCMDLVNNYTCTCLPGYEGGNCDTDIDECMASAPCHVNATCTNLPGSFLCQCNVGYSGDGVLCTDVYECSNDGSPCHSNATCVITEGSFLCACLPGFTGDGQTCLENSPSSCASQPCQNGGTCVNQVPAFLCQCPENTTGLFCENRLYCGCVGLVNTTVQELEERIQEIRSQLLLETSQLSQTVRKKISIPDERPLSVGIGAIGASFLAFVFLLIILNDVIRVPKKPMTPNTTDNAKEEEI